MNADHDVQARLQNAAGLSEILAAAHDAFEWMLSVLEVHENPASAMFAPFVMAGGAVADGRDAVAFAPSFPVPASRARTSPSAGRNRSLAPDLTSAADAAKTVAAVCAQLVARLAEAGPAAADRGDQIACADAGHYAGKIRRLVTGDGS